MIHFLCVCLEPPASSVIVIRILSHEFQVGGVTIFNTRHSFCQFTRQTATVFFLSFFLLISIQQLVVGHETDKVND